MSAVSLLRDDLDGLVLLWPGGLLGWHSSPVLVRIASGTAARIVRTVERG